MKKTILSMLTVMALLASCGGDQKHVPFEEVDVGDTVRDTTQATTVINKSALCGNWVMPNPIDDSSYTGFTRFYASQPTRSSSVMVRTTTNMAASA